MKRYGLKCWLAFASILCVIFGPVYAETPKGEQKMTVSGGKKVSFEYTLTLEDKTVVDTNVGAEPLTYIHGSHQIVRGLEKGLEGMKVGENKQVVVKSEEGYGVVNKEAFVEIRKKQIPQEALKVGAQLQGRNPQGKAVSAQVAEIKEETVVLNFNHPLAGKTLHFDVKVVGIQDVPEE